MIMILGASGYIGKEFINYFNNSNIDYISVSLKREDYNRFKCIDNLIKSKKPSLIINCAGFTGKPNVDSCETSRSQTILGNIIFPINLANACMINGIPLGHISSGCIYTGGKYKIKKQIEIIKDFTESKYIEYNNIDINKIIGYTEKDMPNFTFENNNCSFYSGTKALSEKLLVEFPQIYLWRLRIPFNNLNNPRNYLSKLLNYEKVYENINSITHLGEFVEACFKCYNNNSPYGIYNIVNTKPLRTIDVIKHIKTIISPKKDFKFWKSNKQFYDNAAQALRSNCVLDNSKLLKLGIKLRSAESAIIDSLKNWKW